MLKKLHEDMVSRPTEETITSAIAMVHEVGMHFKSVEEVQMAAKVLAANDLGRGVKAVKCSEPAYCMEMAHLERFLAATPGAQFHVPMNVREEILRDVLTWRSRTFPCNPCPHSATTVAKGLDPYMAEQDRLRAVESTHFFARAAQ